MMITYDDLWWIKSTYDGWRRLKIVFWRKPALNPTKYYENKTLDVFFHGEFDFKVKTKLQPNIMKIRPRTCFFKAHLILQSKQAEI